MFELLDEENDCVVVAFYLFVGSLISVLAFMGKIVIVVSGYKNKKLKKLAVSVSGKEEGEEKEPNDNKEK